ncbi:MAG: hypothetical protein ACOH1P_04610 [Lysobacter sp.]
MRATVDAPRQCDGAPRWLRRGGAMLAVLLAVAACTGEPAGDIGAAPADAPAVASADLIGAALAAGEITQHEATVYRVQAVFGDPALPERFAGAPAADHGAVIDAWIELDEMPGQLAAAVRPYLLRPTDPTSAFAGAARNQSDGNNQCPSAKQRREDPAFAAEGGECTNWISQALLPTPFRVWACATATRTKGSQILDEKLQADLTAALQTMIQPRPDGMGPPLPDVSNHREHRDLDELLDIYIVPTCALTPVRYGHQGVMEMDTYGMAFPTKTSTPRSSADGRQRSATSGYVLIEESLLGNRDDFMGTVVHEVFHLQQFAQNVDILPAVSWFMESTATWAEIHFGPRDHRCAYEWHLPNMQGSPLELTATVPHKHQYQAHVWPLYMQQHAATGADSIFSVWESLADSAPHLAAEHLLQYIDRHVPWQQHFPRFAAQLLNLRLAGDPIAPYFTDVDRLFPANLTPDLKALNRQHRLPAGGDPVLDYSGWKGEPRAPGVPGLAYRYDRIVIDPRTLPKSWGIKLTPDEKLKATGAAGWMELLIREKEGTFRRVAVDPTAGGEWCDVREMVVILSVPNATGRVEGTMTASIEAAPLCALNGDLKFNVSGDYKSPILQLPAPDTATLQVTGNLVVKLGPAQERPKDGARVPPPALRKRYGLPEPEMERFYPDAGSQWSVNGSLVESTCVRRSFDCVPRDATEFTSGDPSKIKLEVIEADGQLTLVGSLPVVKTVTPHLPSGQKVRTTQTSWQLVCHGRGGFGASLASDVGSVFLSGTRGSTPLGGRRVRGKNTVEVHCDNTWSSYRYQGDGEVSTIREAWTGGFSIGN